MICFAMTDDTARRRIDGSTVYEVARRAKRLLYDLNRRRGLTPAAALAATFATVWSDREIEAAGIDSLLDLPDTNERE